MCLSLTAIICKYTGPRYRVKKWGETKDDRTLDRRCLKYSINNCILDINLTSQRDRAGVESNITRKEKDVANLDLFIFITKCNVSKGL